MASETPLATLKAIQARGYRSLKHVDLRFDGNFQVLVGRNGSGKSTLLDAIAFLSDYMNLGLEKAVGKRTQNFQDLAWGRPSRSPGFELAAEFRIGTRNLRYELKVEESGDRVKVVFESGYLERYTPEEFALSARSSSICEGDQASSLKQRQIFGQDANRLDRDVAEDVLWFRPENKESSQVPVRP